MNIDLDLTHYSIEDLQRFFDVKSDCTSQELDKKEANLLSRLIHISMESSKKQGIELFVRSAKERLLIPKQIEPFVYSNPGEYFKGTLNPVDTRIITKFISIDTLFRPNYKMTTSTDFIYQFPEYRKNVVSIKVDALELPHTWYMFCAPTNTFTVTTNATSTIYIPKGNYTVDQFNQLHTSIGLPVQVDPFTGKTVIKLLDPFTVDFTMDSCVLQQTCGWVLGFRSATYTSTTVPDSDGYYSVTSEGSYGSVDNYFFLEIDDFQNNFMTDSIVSVVNRGTPTFLGNNIIARIPVNSSVFGDKFVQFKRDYFGPVTLERLRIRLLNRFGEVVSLQSNDFSFSLELKELYS
jgi:hypothetical protein